MSDLDTLIAQVEQAEAGSTARRDWHPGQCGEIDIRIASDGRWYHEGRPFQRASLVKLFASVLRLEDDGHYYLLTPAEKLRIQVDDAPFVAVRVDRIQEHGRQALLFTTNLEEQVIADQDHPIWVEQHPQSGAPRPYLRCRDSLPALIGRAPYLELAEWGVLETRQGRTVMMLESLGNRFELGAVEETD